jgi:hypothetical protein
MMSSFCKQTGCLGFLLAAFTCITFAQPAPTPNVFLQEENYDYFKTLTAEEFGSYIEANELEPYLDLAVITKNLEGDQPGQLSPFEFLDYVYENSDGSVTYEQLFEAARPGELLLPQSNITLTLPQASDVEGLATYFESLDLSEILLNSNANALDDVWNQLPESTQLAIFEPIINSEVGIAFQTETGELRKVRLVDLYSLKQELIGDTPLATEERHPAPNEKYCCSILYPANVESLGLWRVFDVPGIQIARALPTSDLDYSYTHSSTTTNEFNATVTFDVEVFSSELGYSHTNEQTSSTTWEYQVPAGKEIAFIPMKVYLRKSFEVWRAPVNFLGFVQSSHTKVGDGTLDIFMGNDTLIVEVIEE